MTRYTADDREKTSSLSRIIKQFGRKLSQPYFLLSIIMLLVMAYLIIIPLYRMVYTSFTISQKDLVGNPTAQVGDLTLLHWSRMLASNMSKIMLLTPLKHSIEVALGATFIALLLGSLMAWFVIRTDMPGRKLINSLAVIPYMMPSWTIAMAWLVLFKNRTTGGSQGFLEYVLGTGLPCWLAYGVVPIIISSALHYYPFFYLFVSSALMSIDSNLEEAGELSGASRRKILMKITFPLIIPAILSGFIMTFSRVMGTFGGPNILGVPVRYYTLSTMIRANMNLGSTADGFVLALIMIGISMITIFLNQRVIGTKKSFETIGGRGLVIKKVKLRNWKPLIAAIVVTTQVLIVIVPIGFLTLNTFMLKSGDYSFNNFTVAHWIGKSDPMVDDGLEGILRNPAIRSGAWNSIKLAISAAAFSALIGVILGYAIVKGRGTALSKVVESLAFIPYIIPAIAFGAVYISMFSKPVGPIPPLYGTFALLVVVSVAKNLPFSSRTGVSSMLQVGRELEEAAEVSGASAWLRFKRIIFPLTRSGFISGFLLTFITTMRELSLIILLVSPTNQVLASMTMRYTENGNEQKANAVIILLIAIILFVNFIINHVKGGGLEKGLGVSQ